MAKTASLLTASLAALCFLTSPAAAQNVRSFVSAATGADSNPCTRTSPCRTFAAALTKTNAGGEINTLDPGGYGPVTIAKAMSIVSGLGEAGVLVPANGTGVTINAGPNDAVNLRGLIVEGAGVGATGIAFNSGGSLTIENMVVRNLTSSGIAIAPTAAADISVSNTLVANNGGHGIYIQPSGANIGAVRATFNHVEVDKNVQKGIGIFGNAISGASSVNAIAIDCVAAYNDAGYYALGSSVLRVFRSAANYNAVAADADGNSQIFVSQSNLEGNTNVWAWDAMDGAVINSYGDNYTEGSIAPATIGRN